MRWDEEALRDMTGDESRELEALSSAEDATTLLSAAWRAGYWPSLLEPPRVSAVRELRRHAGSRRTLLLTLSDSGAGERQVIAKLYARADASATTLNTLTALARLGFVAPGAFRAPTVVASLPPWRLLLCELAPGVSVKARLRGVSADSAPTAEAAEAAEAAARWLAAFDAAPLAAPSIYALHDPLAQAARWCSRLAQAMPLSAAPAWSLYAALMSARPPWPPSTPRMIHGDFVMEHIFVAPGAADGAAVVTVIDWDSCRPGDPAEDAGRFVASLWGLYARGHADANTINGAAERFMATYTAEQPESAPHAPFYAALACLRKASRVRPDARNDGNDGNDGPQGARAARLLAVAEALLVSCSAFQP